MIKQTFRTVLPLMGLLLLLALPSAAAGSDDTNDAGLKRNQSINWLNYSDAMTEGRARNKKIMLLFTIGGDLWCDKMKNETFSDTKVKAYLNKHFAVSKIYRDKYPTLAKKYKVDAMPTIWFLDEDGKGLTSTDGFMPPHQMLLLLEFIQKDLYKETTFKQWKEDRPSR